MALDFILRHASIDDWSHASINDWSQDGYPIYRINLNNGTKIEVTAKPGQYWGTYEILNVEVVN